MHIAMSWALIVSWHDFQLFLGDFTGSGAVWFLIGFILSVVLLAKVATEATLVLHAPHRRQSRAGWSPEVAKSTVAASPAKDRME
jgi:hypothetical protein